MSLLNENSSIKSILFITFYDPTDYIEDIITEFESLSSNNKFTVQYYPYLKYSNDLHMSTESILDDLIKTLKDKNVTHIFWFFLPENSNFYESIKRNVSNIKFIFYNFDDLKNFNINTLNIANRFDYFIQPSLLNLQKYSLVLKNNVFYVPQYVHVDLVKITNLSDENIDENIDDYIDCIIVVENEYKSLDIMERIMLKKYIENIKYTLLKSNYTLKLFGDSDLENIYPDIYEDELNILNEGIYYSNSKCIILLDMLDTLNKITSNKIIHALLNNKKIFTNSNIIIKYARNIISNPDLQILDFFENLNQVIEYIDSYKTIKTASNNNDDHKIDIKYWVTNILSIIKN